MQIIPAIDLIDGKCVRLTQGDYAKKSTYFEDPLDMAKQLEDHGIQRLHLVDLDGAKSQKIVNWKVLQRIANHTDLIIDFGGGIKSDESIKIAFDCGAAMITGGSIAVKNQALFLSWIDQYGADKIILGADVKREFIATHGWKETSNLNLFDFLDFYLKKGIQQVICTDIAKDGMLKGPSIELYQKIISKFPSIQLIASGGVSNLEDLGVLQKLGCSGAIIGKAIYEGKISLAELSILN